MRSNWRPTVCDHWILAFFFMGCSNKSTETAANLPLTPSEPQQAQADVPDVAVRCRNTKTQDFEEYSYDVTLHRPGTLTISLGPMMTKWLPESVTDLSGHRIRIVLRLVSAKAVLDHMVYPLFGAEQAAHIRSSIPNSDERQIAQIWCENEHNTAGAKTFTTLGPQFVAAPWPMRVYIAKDVDIRGTHAAEAAEWLFISPNLDAMISKPGAAPERFRDNKSGDIIELSDMLPDDLMHLRLKVSWVPK
jgi:hypothetical protein